MQDHSYLILAQSGRFLAQSLRFTDCPIWVADSFGDSDTLSACSQWLALTSLDDLAAIRSLLAQLPNDKNFNLICGSGVERFYPALTKLKDNIRLIGNSTETIKSIKTPKLFFKQLKQLEIPHPETLFIQPQASNFWLTKSEQGMGGTHIHYLGSSSTNSDCYFQRYHPGVSGSALVLANGESASLLSLNRHFYSSTDTTPFRLSAIDNSLSLNHEQRSTVDIAISTLTQYYGLLGLNSFDFIIDQDGKLLFTEINPRSTASVELLPDSINAMQLHLQACRGQLPKVDSTPNIDFKACLIYHFAPSKLTTHSDMVWPNHCFDIPNPQTEINHQQIVCTSVIKNCHYDFSLHNELAQDIFGRME